MNNWKPNEFEYYYYIGFDKKCHKMIWYKNDINIMRYKLGNFYMTEKEAIRDKEKWGRFYEDGV